jgi:hypothetical protein
MSRVTAPTDSVGIVRRFTKVQLAAILGMIIVYVFFYVLLPNADAAAFLAAGGCLPVLVGFPYGFMHTWSQLKDSIRDDVASAGRTMGRARNACIAVGGLSLAALLFVRPMTWTLAAALGVLGLGNAISLGITFELIRRDLASR